MTEKSEKIKTLLLSGTTYPEITRQTGAASSTIAYHAKKLGVGKFVFKRIQYDWVEIQAYYDAGYRISDIIEKFGMNWSTIAEARARGDLNASKKQRNIPKKLARERKARLLNTSVGATKKKRICYSDEFLFSEGCEISKNCVKNRFKEITKYSCSNTNCILFDVEKPDWAGEPIILHMDHINGIRNDNRLGNLRWLCPNCHSQTSTYCGRNKGR